MGKKKRNRGKARKEAKMADDDPRKTTSGSVQSLAWQQINQSKSSSPCMHGNTLSLSSSRGRLCADFLTSFRDAFFHFMKRDCPGLMDYIYLTPKTQYCLFNCIQVAQDATQDKFTQVWKDPSLITIVNSFLFFEGAKYCLQDTTLEIYGIVRITACIARFFEQYIEVELKQSQPLINWPKIGESHNADEHTLIKFFRHRIPCSCLDEKYEDMKRFMKMGVCYNPQCPKVSGFVPRSKTKYCGRCRNVTYCSRECQVANWGEHKQGCDRNADIISKFEAERQRYEDYLD